MRFDLENKYACRHFLICRISYSNYAGYLQFSEQAFQYVYKYDNKTYVQIRVIGNAWVTLESFALAK